MMQCDDCIPYPVIRCRELGLSLEEVWKVCNVGLVVDESIVIPHPGRSGAPLDELEENEEQTNATWRLEK